MRVRGILWLIKCGFLILHLFISCMGEENTAQYEESWLNSTTDAKSNFPRGNDLYLYNVEPVSETELSVRWFDYTLYRFHKYQVHYNDNFSTCLSDVGSFIISNLHPYTSYNVFVRGCVRNKNGYDCSDYEDTDTRTVYTATASPNITNITAISASSLRVESNRVSPEHKDVYRYKYYIVGDDFSYCTVLHFEITQCTITGLSPNKTYTVCAKACTRNYCWQSSESICMNATTLAIDTPKNFMASLIEPKRILFNWTKDYPYDVTFTYSYTKDGEIYSNSYYYIGEECFFTFQNPCINYTFTLSNCYGVGNCGRKAVLYLSPFAMKLVNVSVKNVEASSAKVVWKAPSDFMQCNYLGYMASAKPCYRFTGDVSGSKCLVDKFARSCILKGLQSDECYEIFVAPIPLNGAMTQSEPITIHTANDTRKLKIILMSIFIPLVIILVITFVILYICRRKNECLRRMFRVNEPTVLDIPGMNNAMGPPPPYTST